MKMPGLDNRKALVPAGQTEGALHEAYRVIVFNDPAIRKSYAAMVLARVFHFPDAVAREHMLQIHRAGLAVVWQGARELAEAHVLALQHWHLLARLECDETN